MSDMEEVEGPAGPVAPHRVIGTPPPTPRLLGTAVEDGGAADGHGAAPGDGRRLTWPARAAVSRAE